MKKSHSSRRDFLRKSAIASGALATFNSYTVSGSLSNRVTGSDKLPREVWIATTSQQSLRAKTAKLMVGEIFNILEDNTPNYKPDIICLPESFPFANIEETNISWEEKLKISSEVLKQFSNYAKKNNCYIICPVYTTENGNIYNSSVVFDREGTRLGEYRKAHITVGEIADGITPGPVDPPVFQADFGKIGIQTCYDIKWEDGWKKLSEKGAEIVFWPSAYASGREINAKAWQNRYHIVSGTQKDTAKICDLTGEVICQTGTWKKNFICAPVNLEKVFLHTWPTYRKFDEIIKKYGRKIQITTFHEEEWSIIESLSPDVSIPDIMKEFNLRSETRELQDAEIAQLKACQ